MRAKIRYIREKSARKNEKNHAYLLQCPRFNVQPTIFHGFSTSRRRFVHLQKNKKDA